jgi:hypothetical protein
VFGGGEVFGDLFTKFVRQVDGNKFRYSYRNDLKIVSVNRSG